MILKYIVFSSAFPLFPCCGIGHDAIMVAGMKPTSAGFSKITIVDGELHVRCYGRSESLNLESKPSDAELIKAMTDPQLLKSFAPELVQ